VARALRVGVGGPEMSAGPTVILARLSEVDRTMQVMNRDGICQILG
jgi:hypothetical protein